MAYASLQGDPFTSLPTEVISSIVSCAHAAAIEAVEERIVITTKRLQRYLDPILSLTAVSRRLRNIMLESPSFWSHIEYRPGLAHEELVLACLERSRNKPLTIIYIGEEDAADDLAPKSGGEILLQLMEHSHRWISLTVIAPNSEYLDTVLHDYLSSVKAPILTKLYLGYQNENEEEMQKHTLSSNFPSLRHVRLDMCPLPCLGLNCELITHLELDLLNDYHMLEFEALQLLAQDLTSLEYLLIKNMARLTLYTEIDGFITWQSLLVLAIGSEPEFRDGKIWRHLMLFKAPQLKTLIIINPCTKDLNPPLHGLKSCFASLIAKNMPMVEDLKLVEASFKPESVIPSLSISFPSVTKLTLTLDEKTSKQSTMGNFFHPYGLTDVQFWPQLNSITLGPIENDIVLHSFIACARYRERSGSPITEIFIPARQTAMASKLRVLNMVIGVAKIPKPVEYQVSPNTEDIWRKVNWLNEPEPPREPPMWGPGSFDWFMQSVLNFPDADTEDEGLEPSPESDDDSEDNGPWLAMGDDDLLNYCDHV